jgi:hypothetical protein
MLKPYDILSPILNYSQFYYIISNSYDILSPILLNINFIFQILQISNFYLFSKGH